jgi:hypothetical protein
MVLQQRMDLEPRLQSQQAPDLRLAQGTRTVALDGKGLQGVARHISPLASKGFGDVLRQADGDFHGATLHDQLDLSVDRPYVAALFLPPLALLPCGDPVVPSLTAAHKSIKMGDMRTTIDLPDELFRQAKAKAALDGMRLKDLITRFVEQGLRQSALSSTVPLRRRRSELPVARAATGRMLPDLTHAEIHRILEEEETAGGRAD